MKRLVERTIDDVSMYRFVLYALVAIALTAFVLSFFGEVPFDPLHLAASIALLGVVCWATGAVFARMFRTRQHRESWLITTLLLFLIFPAPTSVRALVATIVVAFAAAASKYLLAVRGRHVFNPAAVAVAITGLVGLGYATWWVASPVLLPMTVIWGGLTVWRTRQHAMAGAALAGSAVTLVVVALIHRADVLSALTAGALSWPILFLVAFMLTEPLTSPATMRWRVTYGILVGVLASSQLQWVAPETALLIGNLLTFALAQRRRIRLSLDSVTELAPGTWEVVATPRHPIAFRSGQFLELQLAHPRPDARGARRVFSIASSPTERKIRFGFTHGESVSSFKSALIQAPSGTPLTATYVGGDLRLPDDPTVPLILVAGGIGITPFRSMLMHLLERPHRRRITLFYGVRHTEDIVYRDLIERAVRVLGLRVIYVVSRPDAAWSGPTGRVTADLIAETVPDLRASTVYVSGPAEFVDSLRRDLRRRGLPARRLKTDAFLGY
jgi:Flavodoxin reductases (ferredoxin-NADPH reductases) family 1